MKPKLLDSFIGAKYERTMFPPKISERFIALERIGGDFSETFIMQEKSTDDLYVLKTHKISETAASDEEKLLRGLKHKGLPKFEEAIEQDGVLYTLRRYIEGEPLSEFLDGLQDADVSQAVDVLLSLCDILIYLHSQPEPIIHRDIKPSNIIVNPRNNSVMLIDFGIARKYNKTAEQDTTYFGTQQFAPPEQYGFAQTDCRSDIYSVGVLMRYWLTGETDTNTKIEDKQLERIASKCTEIAPKMRFQSAEALKKALVSYKGGRRRVAATAAACFLCCTIAVFFIWGNAANTEGGEIPPNIEPTATPPTQMFISPDGNPDSSDNGTMPDYSEDYPTPNGYNDNDYQKMISFFMQGDPYGNNANAIMSVNPRFDFNDPETWTWSTGQNRYNGVQWHEDNGELRVGSISFWNNWYDDEVNTAGGLSGELDVSGLVELQHLTVSNNEITGVIFSGNTILRHLDLGGNGLSSLDVTGLPGLIWLTLWENNLTEINLSKNTLIEILDFRDNLITTIDLSNQQRLREFSIGNNSLTALNLSNNNVLKYLWFWSNEISEQTLIVPVENDLLFVEARNNSFNDLSVFRNLEKLCFLAIRNNFIDLEDAENRASIAAIQAVIDANTINPPSGYAPPGWVEMKFGFIYEPQR
jgi:serine/threonine protein kinase